MAKLTTQDRVSRARVSIMRHPKFCAFSGVLACGPITLDADINPPTACTDGWAIKLHPGFVDAMADQQLRLLLLHEAVHAAYRHLRVWRHLWKENRQLANIAMDHFVNLALMDMDAGEGFVTMPDVGVQPEPKYRGWSVQRIYDDLKKNGSGKGKGKGKGGPMDDHDFDGAGEPSDAEEQRRATEISRALRNGEALARKLRGTGAGSSSALIEDLLTPKVDWAEQMRDFVREVCAGRDESTWARPSRRFMAMDTFMPSMYSERMGELVVGFDTSGSCFDSGTVTRFVSELQGIIDTTKPEGIRVICWDWGIQTDERFPGDTINVPSVRVRGGGGTDGASLFDHLKKEPGYRPQAVINFTDGYVGSWGSYDVPTLWVVTSPGITAPWGRTITMEV